MDACTAGAASAGQQDRGHAGRADRVVAAVGQHQDAVRGGADAQPAGAALAGQAHLGQARVQGLREQRVRAEVLGHHDIGGRGADRLGQGGVGPGMRAGQQRDDDGQGEPGPAGEVGQRVVETALTALEVSHLDVGALAGQPGRRGDLFGDPVARGAGAARHGQHERRRVRGQGEPVRAAVAARPPGADGAAGQRLLVGERLTALRQRVPALGQGLAALGQRVPALGQGLTALRQRVARWQCLPAPGQRVALGQ